MPSSAEGAAPTTGATVLATAPVTGAKAFVTVDTAALVAGAVAARSGADVAVLVAGARDFVAVDTADATPPVTDARALVVALVVGATAPAPNDDPAPDDPVPDDPVLAGTGLDAELVTGATAATGALGLAAGVCDAEGAAASDTAWLAGCAGLLAGGGGVGGWAG